MGGRRLTRGDMSILITGGMGAIGSFVARKLVAMGIEPILYSRHKDLLLIRDIQTKVLIVEGDILDADKLSRTLDTYHVERVIHTAALLGVASGSGPAMAVRVNAEGTATLLQAALKGNVRRVVYASAKGVYSEAKGEYGYPRYKPINEDYPAENNMGFYGLTKLFGEKIGFQYQQQYGIDFIVLRFGCTYGPGKISKHGPVSPMAIFGRMIENVMLGKPFSHPQGGDQKNDIIYNKDTANGIVLACMAEGLTHRIFNIGSGRGPTLNEFADTVKKICPKAEIEIGPGLDYFRRGFNTYSVYDISRAQKELGYFPEYNLEDGVRDYIAMLGQLNIEPTYTPCE